MPEESLQQDGKNQQLQSSNQSAILNLDKVQQNITQTERYIALEKQTPLDALLVFLIKQTLQIQQVIDKEKLQLDVDKNSKKFSLDNMNKEEQNVIQQIMRQSCVKASQQNALDSLQKLQKDQKLQNQKQSRQAKEVNPSPSYTDQQLVDHQEKQIQNRGSDPIKLKSSYKESPGGNQLQPQQLNFGQQKQKSFELQQTQLSDLPSKAQSNVLQSSVPQQSNEQEAQIKNAQDIKQQQQITSTHHTANIKNNQDSSHSNGVKRKRSEKDLQDKFQKQIKKSLERHGKRLGQRARQKLFEKVYGQQAKHLQRQQHQTNGVQKSNQKQFGQPKIYDTIKNQQSNFKNKDIRSQDQSKYLQQKQQFQKLNENLHPSWQAKKQIQTSFKIPQKVETNKIVFDE